MREILFRGKRTDKGKWVQGYYTKNQYYLDEKDTHIIVYPDAYLLPHGEFEAFEIVYPETVGQFSGVKDKNGTKMFEGDIVDVLIGTTVRFAEPVGYKAVVDFKDGAFGIKWNRGVVEEFTPFASYYKPNVTFTVIGNIHDNPELMEV